MKSLSEFYRMAVPPFSVADVSFIARLVSAASRERARHLEMMAAAYLEETKVPVRHCVLVEEQKVDGTVIYYYADRRKLRAA